MQDTYRVSAIRAGQLKTLWTSPPPPGAAIYRSFRGKHRGESHDELLSFGGLSLPLEGGIFGMFFGVPTGLVVYYFVLSARVTPRILLYVPLAALLGGCIAAVFLSVGSAIVTPILTVVVAMFLRLRESQADSDSQ